MKRGPIICIFVVIFMLLACAAAYCFYDTSEESDLGDVNVPTIVKPNVQSQDKPIIDVYWDATCSMGGYAAIENDNLYKTSKERKYDLDIIKQNIEYILGLQQAEEREKEAVEKETDRKRNDQR